MADTGGEARLNLLAVRLLVKPVRFVRWVPCFQCSGIGSLRVQFSDPWILAGTATKCAAACGVKAGMGPTGKTGANGMKEFGCQKASNF
jgi:hypothetical protein